MASIAEQARAEVTLAQTALRDLRQTAAEVARLGLAERRIKISERQAELVEGALMATLAAIGMDEVGQRRARKILAGKLRSIGSG
ncbi:MAG: hypothetical protein ACTHJW_08600 [Streptosporangiaceae bacterium]